jgi:glycyl-tRNA synthetase
LRLREFDVAEIEHIYDPLLPMHAKFELVADLSLPLLSVAAQQAGIHVASHTRLRDALSAKLIHNGILAYYMGKVHIWLQSCGIPASCIQYRQHPSHKLPHYACECWDAEVACSYGWIAVAGFTDRSSHDLTCHSKATKTDLTATRPLTHPQTVQSTTAILNKATRKRLIS